MPYYYVKRFEDGTDDPFFTRMFKGILEIRDLIEMTNNDPRNRQITGQHFDQFYKPIFDSLVVALYSTRHLNKIASDLIKDGQNGNLVKIYPEDGIELINIQHPYIQKEFSSVVEHSSITIKTHLPQLLMDIFGLDIGFLYQRKYYFDKSIQTIRKGDANLLPQYLGSVRPWSEQLVRDIWNQMKHSRWELESVKIEPTVPPIVKVSLPQVYGIPVNQYAVKTFNQCCHLVEDLIAFGFQYRRFSPIGLMEISRAERTNYPNKRFQAFPRKEDVVGWKLEHIDDKDFI